MPFLVNSEPVSDYWKGNKICKSSAYGWEYLDCHFYKV